MTDLSQYELCSQEELAAEAAFMNGIYGADGSCPASVPAESLVWTVERDYPLSRITVGAMNMSVDAWTEWFVEEQAMKAEEGRPDYYDSMLEREIKEPVFLVEAANGSVYIWDGCHRVGASCFAGRTTIPAVVGRSK